MARRSKKSTSTSPTMNVGSVARPPRSCKKEVDHRAAFSIRAGMAAERRANEEALSKVAQKKQNDEDVENQQPIEEVDIKTEAAPAKRGRKPKNTGDGLLAKLVNKFENLQTANEENLAPKDVEMHRRSVHNLESPSPHRRAPFKGIQLDLKLKVFYPNLELAMRSETPRSNEDDEWGSSDEEEEDEEEEGTDDESSSTTSSSTDSMSDSSPPRRIGRKQPLKKMSNEEDVSPRKKRRSDISEDANVKDVELTPLLRIKAALHTSAIPARLPCRDEEAEAVRRWLKDSLREHRGQALYVSGCPGTGKTATLLSVINELIALNKEGKCPKFRFAYVNVMEFADPRRIFVEIYRQIFCEADKKKKKISLRNARDALNTAFSMRDSSRPPVIIVVDELDMLCTKKQDLIYDVFNWTAWEAAEASVIGVANTLDLPERTLPPRVTSRLGARRVIFQPYTHEEIEEIVLNRLKAVEGIEKLMAKEAIQLASRKVANLSGDLRKALDILRHAIDRSARAGSGRLEIEHVNATIRSMGEQPLHVFVRGLPLHGRLLFAVLVAMIESTGALDVSWPKLFAEYESKALHENVRPLNPTSALALVSSLLSSRLLVLTVPSPDNPYERRYALGMAANEGRFALNATGKKMHDERENEHKNAKRRLEHVFATVSVRN